MNFPKKTAPKPFKTRQEIATELGISVSTFRRKLKKKGITLSGGLLNLSEQNRIYQAFGLLESPEIPQENLGQDKA